MKFSQKLVRGKLVKRYKRFLADVELESGEVVTAHCPNSGRMIGLDEPGFSVWMSEKNGNLKYGLELVNTGNTLVGINTMHPNKIVSEAIAENKIPELAGYSSLRREVKYGKNSRIDILLEAESKKPCYVEIKNVHLKRGQHAEFPDAVSERAAKHMRELEEMVKQGHRAVVFFLCQRSDSEKFMVAKDIDPAYNEAFLTAMKAGVEAVCYSCALSPEEISLEKRIEILY